MTHLSSYSLKFYFVAFLDILGFSDIVKHDCESPTDSDNYMRNMGKLFDIYENTLELYSSTTDLEMVQFSDSIVLAIPFSKDKFSFFIKIVSKFQYDLFSRGLLCRGGIAYGKHFLKGGFLFSNGLIEAYKIERNIAKHPRVAVSTDLIELIYKDKKLNDGIPLVKEIDDVFFVDFLANNNISNSAEYLKSILDNVTSSDISVQEKLRWLTEYFDYKAFHPNSSISKFGKPRFSVV